jgi:hypothetical protein
MARNGFLAAPDATAIVECLEELASSSERAQRMAAAGQSFALANHDQDRLAEEITELYQNLLAAHGAREHAGALATTPEET